jgi:uncharacterized membrane protein YcaP (DUF421 family)
MDWKNIFLGDLDWAFTAEILLRSIIMFTTVIVFLRLSGKKGVRQLSLFEVAIIISLGSAVGDPMFNKDIPIVPALIVMITIILFYLAITWLSVKSTRFESLLEGDPIYIIEEGMFNLENGRKHNIAKDEFYAEMRQENIEHLGQVKQAILETNGKMSFIFYSEEDIKPGLPIWPKEYEKKVKHIPSVENYACVFCGNIEQIDNGAYTCNRCTKDEWVLALNSIRR